MSDTAGAMQIFKHTDFGQVRVFTKNGEPWFVAKDIANILGYSLTEKMTRRLDDDEKTIAPFRDSGSNYQTNLAIINESGFYNAVLGSHKPEAKRFKKWVTSEVLPSIRKTGTYSVNEKRQTKAKPTPTPKHHGSGDPMANINIFIDGMFQDAASKGKLSLVKKSDLAAVERGEQHTFRLVDSKGREIQEETAPKYDYEEHEGDMGDRFLRVSEVAAQLRTSASSVYRLVDEGYLRSLKLPGLNGKVLISEKDFKAFIKARKI